LNPSLSSIDALKRLRINSAPSDRDFDQAAMGLPPVTSAFFIVKVLVKRLGEISEMFYPLGNKVCVDSRTNLTKSESSVLGKES
jgi:hypothetical protein